MQIIFGILNKLDVTFLSTDPKVSLICGQNNDGGGSWLFLIHLHSKNEAIYVLTTDHLLNTQNFSNNGSFHDKNLSWL